MAKRNKIIQEKPLDINPDFEQTSTLLGGYSYKNELMMIKITDFNKELLEKAASSLISTTFRLDALTAVLVLDGSLTLSVDYRDITLPQKTLLMLSPMNTITGSSISTGGRFFLLMIKRDILDRIGSTLNPRPVIPATPTFADFFLHPYFQLEESTYISLERSFQNLYYYLKDNRQNIRGFLIDHSLSILLLEILHFWSENTELNLDGKPLTRKKEIMSRFMSLIRDFGETQHNPAFYADRLFISVQYLSLISKEETGQTAARILASHLAKRARNMLRSPGASIKETAAKLNFADQSSFGKFFRKETGMTPKKYIESL